MPWIKDIELNGKLCPDSLGEYLNYEQQVEPHVRAIDSLCDEIGNLITVIEPIINNELSGYEVGGKTPLVDAGHKVVLNPIRNNNASLEIFPNRVKMAGINHISCEAAKDYNVVVQEYVDELNDLIRHIDKYNWRERFDSEMDGHRVWLKNYEQLQNEITITTSNGAPIKETNPEGANVKTKFSACKDFHTNYVPAAIKIVAYARSLGGNPNLTARFHTITLSSAVQSAGATLTNIGVAACSGLSRLGEGLVDGVDWVVFHTIGGAVSGIASALGDGTFAEGYQAAVAKSNDRIAVDRTAARVERFYNTDFGQCADQHSWFDHNSEVFTGISTGVEKAGALALATAATVFTGGAVAPFALGALYGIGTKAQSVYQQNGGVDTWGTTAQIIGSGVIHGSLWAMGGKFGARHFNAARGVNPLTGKPTPVSSTGGTPTPTSSTPLLPAHTAESAAAETAATSAEATAATVGAEATAATVGAEATAAAAPTEAKLVEALLDAKQAYGATAPNTYYAFRAAIDDYRAGRIALDVLKELANTLGIFI